MFTFMFPASTRVDLYSQIEFELLQKCVRFETYGFSFAVTKMKIHLRQMYTTTI